MLEEKKAEASLQHGSADAGHPETSETKTSDRSLDVGTTANNDNTNRIETIKPSRRFALLSERCAPCSTPGPLTRPLLGGLPGSSLLIGQQAASLRLAQLKAQLALTQINNSLAFGCQGATFAANSNKSIPYISTTPPCPTAAAINLLNLLKIANTMSNPLYNPYASGNQSSSQRQYGLLNTQAERDSRGASSFLGHSSSLRSPGASSGVTDNSRPTIPPLMSLSRNHRPEQNRSAMDEDIASSVDMHISRAREKVRLLGQSNDHPVDQDFRFSSSQKDDYLPFLSTGMDSYPKSSTAAPQRSRDNLDGQSGSSSFDYSSNYKRPAAEDSKFYTPPDLSNYPRSVDGGFNKSIKKEREGLSEYDYQVSHRPAASTGSNPPKYTSEIATKVLCHFGLEKQDLEHLISYPEDQITPDNLPFILRQIRFEKDKRSTAAVQSKTFPESHSTRTLSGVDSYSLNRTGETMMHQHKTSGAVPKPSTVIDYGHTSKYTAVSVNEIGRKSDRDDSGRISGMLAKDCAASKYNLEPPQKKTVDWKGSAMGSSREQGSSFAGLSSSCSSASSSATSQGTDQTKRLQIHPNQTMQNILSSFPLPKKDTDNRDFKCEDSQPVPLKHPQVDRQSKSTLSHGLHPSRPGPVLMGSDDASTKDPSKTKRSVVVEHIIRQQVKEKTQQPVQAQIQVQKTQKEQLERKQSQLTQVQQGQRTHMQVQNTQKQQREEHSRSQQTQVQQMPQPQIQVQLSQKEQKKTRQSQLQQVQPKQTQPQHLQPPQHLQHPQPPQHPPQQQHPQPPQHPQQQPPQQQPSPQQPSPQQPSQQQPRVQQKQKEIQPLSQAGQTMWPPVSSAAQSVPPVPFHPGIPGSPRSFVLPPVHPQPPAGLVLYNHLAMLTPNTQSSTKVAVSKDQPTTAMMNDYAATTPRLFPHTCSLCNKTCTDMQDWITHQNTSLHLDSCKTFRRSYPDWDAENYIGSRTSGKNAKPSTSAQTRRPERTRRETCSRSKSKSPRRRRRGSEGRRNKRRSRSGSSHRSRYQRRSRTRSRSRSRSRSSSRSLSRSPRHDRRVHSRYRSRSRSRERQSPSRWSGRRLSMPRSKRERRSSSESDSCPEEEKKSKAESLAKKLLETSGFQSLSNQNDLEAVVKSLAPALVAELSKIKSSSSSSSSGKGRKRSSSPSSAGGKTSSTATNASKAKPNLQKTESDEESPSTVVTLLGVGVDVSHSNLLSAVEQFGKTKSVVVFRAQRKGIVTYEKEEDAKKLRSEKVLLVNGIPLSIFRHKEPTDQEEKTPPPKKPAPTAPKAAPKANKPISEDKTISTKPTAKTSKTGTSSADGAAKTAEVKQKTPSDSKSESPGNKPRKPASDKSKPAVKDAAVELKDKAKEAAEVKAETVVDKPPAGEESVSAQEAEKPITAPDRPSDGDKPEPTEPETKVQESLEEPKHTAEDVENAREPTVEPENGGSADRADDADEPGGEVSGPAEMVKGEETSSADKPGESRPPTASTEGASEASDGNASAGEAASSEPQLASSSATVTPLTVGEKMEQLLDPTKIGCFNVKRCFNLRFSKLGKRQLLVSDLPEFNRGCYTEDDVAELLAPFGFRHADDSIFVFPQARVAFVMMPTVKSVRDALKASVVLKGAPLLIKVLTGNQMNEPLGLYSTLMQLMTSGEMSEGDKTVLIKNISLEETEELRDALRDFGSFKNFMPLLNKVFIEFKTVQDSDRFPAWYSLFKPERGNEVHKMTAYKCSYLKSEAASVTAQSDAAGKKKQETPLTREGETEERLVCKERTDGLTESLCPSQMMVEEEPPTALTPDAPSASALGSGDVVPAAPSPDPSSTASTPEEELAEFPQIDAETLQALAAAVRQHRLKLAAKRSTRQKDEGPGGSYTRLKTCKDEDKSEKMGQEDLTVAVSSDANLFENVNMDEFVTVDEVGDEVEDSNPEPHPSSSSKRSSRERRERQSSSGQRSSARSPKDSKTSSSSSTSKSSKSSDSTSESPKKSKNSSEFSKSPNKHSSSTSTGKSSSSSSSAGTGTSSSPDKKTQQSKTKSPVKSSERTSSSRTRSSAAARGETKSAGAPEASLETHPEKRREEAKDAKSAEAKSVHKVSAEGAAAESAASETEIKTSAMTKGDGDQDSRSKTHPAGSKESQTQREESLQILATIDAEPKAQTEASSRTGMDCSRQGQEATTSDVVKDGRSTRGTKEETVGKDLKDASDNPDGDEEGAFQILDSVEDETVNDEPTTAPRASRGRRGRTKIEAPIEKTKKEETPTRSTRTPASSAPTKKSAGEEASTFEILDSVDDDVIKDNGASTKVRRKRGRPKKQVRTAKKEGATPKTTGKGASDKLAEDEEEATYQIVDSVEDESVDDQPPSDQSASERKETLSGHVDQRGQKCESRASTKDDEEEKEPRYQIVDSLEDEQVQGELAAMEDSNTERRERTRTKDEEDPREEAEREGTPICSTAAEASEKLVVEKEVPRRRVEGNDAPSLSEEPSPFKTQSDAGKLEKEDNQESPETQQTPSTMVNLDEVSDEEEDYPDDAAEEEELGRRQAAAKEKPSPKEEEGRNSRERRSRSGSRGRGHGKGRSRDTRGGRTEEVDAQELVTLDEVGPDDVEEDGAQDHQDRDGKIKEGDAVEVTRGQAGPNVLETNKSQEDKSGDASNREEAGVGEEQTDENQAEKSSRLAKRKRIEDKDESLNFVTVDEVGEEEEEEEEQEQEVAPSKRRGRGRRARRTPVRKSARGKTVSPKDQREEEEKERADELPSSTPSDKESARLSDCGVQKTAEVEAAVPPSAGPEKREEAANEERSRAAIKVVSKSRRELHGTEAKRSRSQSPSVSADFKLPEFKPNNPLGQEFVVPKSGFFCNICSVFYLNEKTAKEIHCSSQKHYDNLQNYYQKIQKTSLRCGSVSD